MSLGEELRLALNGKWGHVREQARSQMPDFDLLAQPGLPLEEQRERTLKQLTQITETGIHTAGFREEGGGTGKPGVAVTGIEMLAQFDLSLMVKAGVQWGLFGGAVENLGTERHRPIIQQVIDLDLLGCFAMTETGQGSDVQNLETTATYDPDTQEFVVHSPTPSARKDYIGNAARDGQMAAVFAQLVTGEETHGVHCLLVPIRDEHGNPMPGVTIGDCGHKGGLAGVDNGRLTFEHVRVPRENLLNRYGDVAADGTYTSPIEDINKRFFTMLGTLIRGRVSVGGSARSAAEVALSIAGRYALQRQQFEKPDGAKITLMDYLLHQRRLLPLIARGYAYRFAQNQLVARMNRLQTTDEPDPMEQRELEARAAGLKAMQTWFAMDAVRESREACGGAGYLAENRLVGLRNDLDVFTTFEGDNFVLMQLVAKELLTSYADEVRGLDPVGMARFAVETVADVVRERTVGAELVQRLIDTATGNDDLLERGTQLEMFEDRAEHVLETLARRMRRAQKNPDEAFEVFNAAQDHVIRAARTHVERITLEAFVAGIARCDDEDAAEVLRDVASLYALTSIEDDNDWFMGHNRLSDSRAKAITAEVNRLCMRLRPHTEALIEGFGVPVESLGAELLSGR